MIKLLIITTSNTYEVICTNKHQAYNYMLKTHKNGGYAFYLNLNYPNTKSSPNVEYYTMKQHLDDVRQWQVAYKNNDLFTTLKYTQMFEKLYKNQGISPVKELRKLPRYDRKIEVA